MKHKHCDLIKAWADGTEIQQKHPIAPRKWEDIEKFPSWSDSMEYRIKPKVIKYRNFLWYSECSARPLVSLCTYEEHKGEPREGWKNFIKWLGDWQEVEV